MKVNFSARDLDELFAGFGQNAGAIVYSAQNEYVIELPQQIGKGRTQHLKLRSGLELTLSSYECQEPMLFQGNLDCTLLVLRLCVSGYARRQLQGIKEECNLSKGMSHLSFEPGLEGSFECPDKKIGLCEIRMTPDALKTLIDGQLEQIPPELRQVALGNYQGVYLQTRKMTRLMQTAAEQIFNCPYQGLTKRLYLESKVIELIAFYLHQLSEETTASDSLPLLRRYDIERIHQAKEILLNNLENPPSLYELARQVGLNEFKLKRGFRQVFDTTVFGYLHQQRMERAWKLLNSGMFSVTDVAGAVGYASLSSFNAAFKCRFGINPSVCKYERHSSN
ncbi:helix-turn-helix domain-containing protein [Fischerella thermalis]|uniref:AraC family transcriptional regulatory protein n=1 Tax=Fischerella sp. MV11 TaxID=397321 RepID=E1U3M3_9CYAN|nr:AraC family transcriptional regulator [Fischerella thermalis]ACN96030.1 AraC family transcriptional regulatory protein [Fischerella sp. MV11]PMB20314.1 AraC family transcriptional regulator [Fischerella thermalis CCMEE 5319]